MDGKSIATLWTMGYGDMKKAFSGDDTREPQTRALKSDWETLPMPRDHVEIELGLPISEEELGVLSLGHIPRAMEDHWFTCFDGEALCIYRSWTGICIYKIHVRRSEDGYELASVTVNRDSAQYNETSDERDRIFSAVMVGEALGRDVSKLWEEWFRLEKGSEEDNTLLSPIGFWHEQDELGCCSNWHEKGFGLFGVRFATAEHWMMWQKARAMGDPASADKILRAPTPKHAKQIGGKVKPFHGGLWHAVREQLVYVGVREKFLQNPDIAAELLSTGNRVLAEASPLDHEWGVGIAADDPGFADFSNWKGDNLQGRVCMRVRADLRLLMTDERVVAERGTTEEDLEEVLYSTVGRMSLLALTRNPVTRDSAMCYARIAQYHMRDDYSTLRDFLQGCGQKEIGDIDEAMATDRRFALPLAGWKELLVQLAFLRRVGRL